MTQRSFGDFTSNPINRLKGRKFYCGQSCISNKNLVVDIFLFFSVTSSSISILFHSILNFYKYGSIWIWYYFIFLCLLRILLWTQKLNIKIHNCLLEYVKNCSSLNPFLILINRVTLNFSKQFLMNLGGQVFSIIRKSNSQNDTCVYVTDHSQFTEEKELFNFLRFYFADFQIKIDLIFFFITVYCLVDV